MSAHATPTVNLLEADVVERVRQLELFSRFRVEGFLNGQNLSPFKGFTADFLQHRQYQPGDPLKHLDWRVFAKSEKLYTREYEELTNARISMILDVSNSMDYRGMGMSKLEFCIRTMALLTYMSFLGHDSISLTTFTTRRTSRLPFGSGKRHLQRMLAALSDARAGGETDFVEGLRDATSTINHKGLTVVFSDCMGEPDHIAKTLQRLRAIGSDVIVFQVFDPSERDFDFSMITRFHDMEGNEVLAMDAPVMRNAYRELFERHQTEMHEACLRRGFDHAVLPVEEAYDETLMTYIRKRMALFT